MDTAPDSLETAPPSPGGLRISDWRRWAPRAAFESLLIVFSVVLAMAVSAWAEDRQTAERVQEMRGFLRAEIQANRSILAQDAYLPHHVRLKGVFGQALGDLDAPVSREQGRAAVLNLFRTGLHLAPVRDAVWNSVSSGDLMEHMDPREVFALAEIYKAQAELEDLNRAGYEASVGLVDVLAGSDRPKPAMMRSLLMLEDLIFQERRLLELYDRALADAPTTATRAPGDGAPAKG